MLGPYLQVLRTPGAVKFSVWGMIARLQNSMAGLGAVMLLSVERGSYAIAGVVAALYAVSMAVISPQASRFIDVFGQRKIVPIQLTVHLPAIAGLIGVAVFTELNWPLFVLAVLAGASQPAVGSLVRTRWSYLLKGKPELRTAFAWESLLDEVVFISGPPLATFLALAYPPAGLAAAAIFLTLGLVFLLRQRDTEPKPSGRAKAAGGKPAILLPGVAGVFGVFVMLGAIFGSVEVITVAFSKEAGQPLMAGVILALYSGGSLIGGLVFGALRLQMSLLRQFMLGVVFLSIVTLPLPFLSSLPLLGIGITLAGLSISPVLITATALIEQVVPSHRLTESIAWTGSGMSAGVALGTPLAGLLIDGFGGATAYFLTAGAGVGSLVLAVIALKPLRRAVYVTGRSAQAEILDDSSLVAPEVAAGAGVLAGGAWVDAVEQDIALAEATRRS